MCRSCEPGWVCVFVCQIKFFFESQGVYIGVWVFVSMVSKVVYKGENDFLKKKRQINDDLSNFLIPSKDFHPQN